MHPHKPVGHFRKHIYNVGIDHYSLQKSKEFLLPYVQAQTVLIALLCVTLAFLLVYLVTQIAESVAEVNIAAADGLCRHHADQQRASLPRTRPHQYP